MQHFAHVIMIITVTTANNDTFNISSNITVDSSNEHKIFEFKFDLAYGSNCAATIITRELVPHYTNIYSSYNFQFTNGSCNTPTLWYSYFPIYHANTSTFNQVFSDNDTITSCFANVSCSQLHFCVSNYNIITLNHSNKTSKRFLFHTFQPAHDGMDQCTSYSATNNAHPSLMTILCGDYNLTQHQFVSQMMNGDIPQCGNIYNPYLDLIRLPSTTSDIIDVDTDEIDTEPICTIYYDDNWIIWLFLGGAFVFVSISMFFCMTRFAHIKISFDKYGAILMLFMSSLAIATILQALITTFVVMGFYDKCNTLQSSAPFTPWRWEEEWEENSLMGFAFWIIGVIISSVIYTVILMLKFNIRSASQYEYGLVKDCGEKCIAWCVKGMFFIITFSFSAILRPYYYIGEHSQSGNKCACVDGNIALISEIYGSALLSIILGPFAVFCGKKFVVIEDDDEDGCNWFIWMIKLCGFMLILYGFYCAFIVVAAPFLFVVYRITEYIESAEELFTSDDLIMFIWFFEGISNFFVDLAN